MRKEAKHIKTSGEFREFLLRTMYDVRYNRIDLHSAMVIVKLADQVNESHRLESVRHYLQMPTTPAPTFGALGLTEQAFIEQK